MMQVAIERMQLSDLGEVMRLDRQCFPTPWRADTYRYEITGNPNARYLVARVTEGGVTHTVGYAGMWLIVGEVHITTIGVDPAYRGKKIGERLLAALLQRALDEGAERITLEVRESNLAAQRLYLKYGFGAVGMRRGYYSDTGENAIIMWIEDVNDPHFRQLMDENLRQLKEQESAPAGH